MSFAVFLLVRLSSVLLVQTCFVADEYWQSLEVAHRWVFGYGYLTWEWRERLRSVLFPGLFAALYQLLALVHLDSVWLLITLPRVLSTVITAVGDASTLRLAEKLFGSACRGSVTLCLLSCWFLQYCAPRTITAVPESTFTALALAAYPWHHLQASGSLLYLWWVGVGCALRPTTALLFLPLFTAHLRARYQSGAALKLLTKAVLIGLSVSACLCCADSLYYGSLTFVPWNFMRFNALSNLADHYGTHPWHWYLSNGLPSALGPHSVPLLLAVWSSPGLYARLLLPVAFALAAYSCVGHKEIRLLLPLLPPLLAVTGDYLSRVQTAYAKKMDGLIPTLRKAVVVLWLTLPSVVLLLVLGLLHQRGPITVMEELQGRLLPEWHHHHMLGEAGLDSREAMLLFLTPCHSTPLYSHLHENVSVRFLTCEPNLHRELNYTDEADRFYEHPDAWLAAHLPSPPVEDVYDGKQHAEGNVHIEKNRRTARQVRQRDDQQDNIDVQEHSVEVRDKTLASMSSEIDQCSGGEDASDCSIENKQRESAGGGDKYSLNWLSLVTAYRYTVVEPMLRYPSHIIMFDSSAKQLKSFITSLGYSLCSSSYHSFVEDGRRGHFLNVYCLPLTSTSGVMHAEL